MLLSFLVLLLARGTSGKDTVLSWWPAFLSAAPPAILLEPSENAPQRPLFSQDVPSMPFLSRLSYSASHSMSTVVFLTLLFAFLSVGIICAFLLGLVLYTGQLFYLNFCSSHEEQKDPLSSLFLVAVFLLNLLMNEKCFVFCHLKAE